MKAGREVFSARDEYKPIISEVASLFGSSQYSDFKIRCGSHSWSAHKAIICTRCEFFDRACNGSFKEAKEGQIDLYDDPEVVDAILRYIYTGAYDDDRYAYTSADLERTDPICLNVRVHNAADKYNLPRLCSLARQKFARRADKSWATPAFADAVYEVYTTSYIVADDDGVNPVEHEIPPGSDIDSFNLTTTTTITHRNAATMPNTMRRTIIDTTMSHLAAFTTSQSPPIAALRSLLYTLPAFAADLCMAQLQRSWQMKSYSTPSSPTCLASGAASLAVKTVTTTDTGGAGDHSGHITELYCCPKCEKEFLVRDPEMEIEFACPRVQCEGRVGWDERLSESRT